MRLRPQYPGAGYCGQVHSGVLRRSSSSTLARNPQRHITSIARGPNYHASSDGSASVPSGRASSGATRRPTKFQGRPYNLAAAAQSAQPVQSLTPPQRLKLQPQPQTLSATLCLSLFCFTYRPRLDQSLLPSSIPKIATLQSSTRIKMYCQFIVRQ
jgi:hypothetical protein